MIVISTNFPMSSSSHTLAQDMTQTDYLLLFMHLAVDSSSYPVEMVLIMNACTTADEIKCSSFMCCIP